jgi:protein-S-isoprenylcysteine O-methyltransferase Ste14
VSAHRDLAIYAVHALAWGAFGVTRRIAVGRKAPAAGDAPVAEAQRTGRGSRALMGFHMFGFFVLYFGLGQAVVPARVPDRFPLQRLFGALVIAGGSAMMCWSLLHFRSWRYRAKIDVGHELATGGPFTFVRHPIYLGILLIAIGTAVWAPTVMVVTGAALVALACDLRGRAEERLLVETFGERYREYRARTKRFLPGVY